MGSGRCKATARLGRAARCRVLGPDNPRTIRYLGKGGLSSGAFPLRGDNIRKRDALSIPSLNLSVSPARSGLARRGRSGIQRLANRELHCWRRIHERGFPLVERDGQLSTGLDQSVAIDNPATMSCALQELTSGAGLRYPPAPSTLAASCSGGKR